MAKYEMRTFADIIAAVMETAKIQSTDTVEKNRIKRNINTIYQDEVIPFKQWQWLRNKANLQHKSFFSTGTASVLSNSVAVTLTESPGISYKGYYFSADGYSEVYQIRSHTANTSAIVLDVPYTGSTNATVKFKIWTDALILPSDCEEILEISHQFSPRPLDNMGLQEFRRVTSTQPKGEGRPSIYTTTDWRDPEPYATISGLPASAARSSSGLMRSIRFSSSLGATEAAASLRPGDRISITGGGSVTYNIEAIVASLSTTSVTNDTISYTALEPLTESTTLDAGFTVRLLSTESYERYRELLIYPSISSTRTSLMVDYIKSVPSLENDADEPLMPMKDRIILYYGALWLTWQRQRNPEESATNFTLFERKLSRMAGKTEDSPDKPMIVPSRIYLSQKRRGQRHRGLTGSIGFGSGGGSSASSVSGTPNTLAIFNSSGELVSSTVISTSDLNYLDGAQELTSFSIAGSAVSQDVLSVALASFTSLFIMYTISRGGIYEAGHINIVTDGSTASIAQGAMANTGDPGVVFSAVVSGSDLKLQYTSTAGGSGTMKYKLHQWLA